MVISMNVSTPFRRKKKKGRIKTVINDGDLAKYKHDYTHYRLFIY